MSYLYPFLNWDQVEIGSIIYLFFQNMFSPKTLQNYQGTMHDEVETIFVIEKYVDSYGH